MEGVVVPKAGLKNALLRDNLYMMGAACFPCARSIYAGHPHRWQRNHNRPCPVHGSTHPLMLLTSASWPRASSLRGSTGLSESSAVRFYTQYLLECFRGLYSIQHEFLAGRREVRADIPCQK